MGEVALGDEEDARGVAVEAVDDAGAELAADAGEVADVVEQGVDEGARAVAGRGMHDDARRLVDRDQVLVLVEDRERDRLGLDRDGARLRHLDRDVLAGAHRPRGPGRVPATRTAPSSMSFWSLDRERSLQADTRYRSSRVPERAPRL